MVGDVAALKTGGDESEHLQLAVRKRQSAHFTRNDDACHTTRVWGVEGNVQYPLAQWRYLLTLNVKRQIEVLARCAAGR